MTFRTVGLQGGNSLVSCLYRSSRLFVWGRKNANFEASVSLLLPAVRIIIPASVGLGVAVNLCHILDKHE